MQPATCLQGSADSILRYFSEEAEGTWAPRCSLLCDFSPQGTKLSIRIGKRKFSPRFQELMMQGSQTIYSSINPFFFQLNFRVHRIGIIKVLCSSTSPMNGSYPLFLPSFFTIMTRMCKPKPKARTLAMIYIQSYSLPQPTHNFCLLHLRL